MDTSESRKVVLHGPWSIAVSKKKNFIPNLNQYRNTHPMVLAKAKREYAKLIREQLKDVEPFKRVQVTLIAYPPTARSFDPDNMAPHMKFALDAIVDMGVLEDDNYKIVIRTIHEVGGIDRENPRVEFIIEELSDG